MELIHATAVDISGHGVLLRGPSGAGKSDLALRLIGDGGILVADDQVGLELVVDEIRATVPQSIAGQMEIRGLGIVVLPYLANTIVRLIVDLVPRQQIERLPEPATAKILGKAIRLVALDPFEASASLKIRAALGVLT